MAKRKTHTAAFKAQVALAAIKDKTVAAPGRGGGRLRGRGKATSAPADAHQAELFEQIGRLKV